MTPKRRFLAAVKREIPDIVPVAPLINQRFANKVLSRIGWKAVFDVHQMIGSIFFRGPLGINFKLKSASQPIDLYSPGRDLVEETGAKKTYSEIISTRKGKLTASSIEGLIPEDPLVGKRLEYFVKSSSDWEIYKTYLEELLEKGIVADNSEVEEAYNTFGENGIASVYTASTIDHMLHIRGMEGMFYDFFDAPEMIKEAQETFWELIRLQIEAFLDSPSEILVYDICTAVTGISPQVFKEFTLPELYKVVDMVKKREGKYVGYYTLGKIRKFLPLLVDTGVDFIETFEPNEGDISLKQAKEIYGKRVCLMGNFDCVVLARGSKEEAKAEAIRCIEEGMKGGGYVLVTGDEVPADAKMENLKVMVEAARDYGKY